MFADTGHYRSLIVAGLGLVGQGVLRLGGAVFGAFERVVLTDIDERKCLRAAERSGYAAVCGDLTEPDFVRGLIEKLTAPVLVVNLCSGIDTVRLRKRLRDVPAAYMDVCASEMAGEELGRFTRLMPYTNEPHHGAYPHLLCQGINPGLVEYELRRLMQLFEGEEAGFAVEIFEDDQLHSPELKDSAAVGWCPAELVEEMMVSPSLEVRGGVIVEEKRIGARRLTLLHQGTEMTVRVVGHEDVWNLASLEPVQEARFLYRLHPSAMELLAGDPAAALQRLRPAEGGLVLAGDETIRVEVQGLSSDTIRSAQWRVNHRAIQERYGLNGIQYQTGLGCLLGICLLQYGRAGTLKGTYNASTLPLLPEDFLLIEQFSKHLGVGWQRRRQDWISL